MKWGALLVVATACGSTTAHSISSSGRDPDVAAEAFAQQPPKLLVVRPPVDLTEYLPDFHDELRWPLAAMEHPRFEPSFAIADELASPGTTWQDLCQRGAQNRYGGKRDLTTYLRGWCQALDGHVDRACETLLPLIGSTAIANFDDVVRTDIANMLASSGHADTAEHIIHKQRIRDIAILDRLAASYVEVGTPQDAMRINDLAIDAVEPSSNATKCMRWTRHIMLLRDRASALATQIASTDDPTCNKLSHKLGCWADTELCTMYVSDMNWVPEVSDLIAAYRAWSQAGRNPDWWTAVALTASVARALPGGSEMAVGAIENAERTSSTEHAHPVCSTQLLSLADYLASTIELGPRLDLRERLRVVELRCSQAATRAP